MLDSLINEKPLKVALVLSIVTIVYNVVEGIISVIFGLNDQTLALLGFGIVRIKNSSAESRDKFESTALRITGFGFYILTAGLVAGSIINIIEKNNPSTTIAGIIVSVISIITMYLLMKAKLKVGEKLNSDAIIADAHCTRTCFNLSIILLLSSLLYEISSIGYFDILGSLGIAYYSFMEGKESFEKAENNKLSCTCS